MAPIVYPRCNPAFEMHKYRLNQIAVSPYGNCNSMICINTVAFFARTDVRVLKEGVKNLFFLKKKGLVRDERPSLWKRVIYQSRAYSRVKKQ